MSEDGEAAESLAALTRFLVGDATMHDTLTRVAELAVKAVPPAAFAGLSMLVEDRVQTAVFTDPTSPEIDQAQYDAGDGPCLAAFRSGVVTEIPSTVTDGPWPEFRRAAAAHGILSTLSLPMVVEDRAVGAMNLYSNEEAAFADADQRAATRFAADAAVVLTNAQAFWDARDLSVHMGRAMESRAVIEQAKGILMGASRCDAAVAFEMLVRASQRENVKLRDIAQRIVEHAAGAAGGDATREG